MTVTRDRITALGVTVATAVLAVAAVAFAASSDGMPQPRSNDLPQVSAPASTTTVSRSAVGKPARRTAARKPASRATTRKTTRRTSAGKKPGKAPVAPSVTTHRSDDHEVVTPRVHESDGSGEMHTDRYTTPDSETGD